MISHATNKVENPARKFNKNVGDDEVFGTVSYVRGNQRYGTLIASDADSFTCEFSSFFDGDYESMVEFINEAAKHGGILSGFDIVDYVSDEEVADLLTGLELFIPADFHITINEDGSISG